MSVDSLYALSPKKYVFGQYTFVEPDLNVKFPSFHCCSSHASSSLQTTSQKSYSKIPLQTSLHSTSLHSTSLQPTSLQKTSSQIPLKIPLQTSLQSTSLQPTLQKTSLPIPLQIPLQTSLQPTLQKTSLHIPLQIPLQTSLQSTFLQPTSLQPTSSQKNNYLKVEEHEHEDMDEFILSDLGNKSGYWLSFIRPNLVFDVVPKSLQQFRKLLSHFQSIYPRGSGIIFCMSKKECDSVTEMVNGALPFHMDLTDQVRNETQRRWENNEVKILCATPAFGKSVNKANVRFVIHHTLPQSLEQYERQCALAGTDGQLSHCVILYSFNDHLRVLRLIKEDVPKPPPNVMEMKEKSLRIVLRYCENVSECRRKNLASCFGEKYSAEQCLATACPCTICEALMDGKQQLKLYDFTGEALAIFSSMGMLRNVVLSYVADLFRGCLTKKRVKQTIDENRHGRLPLFGLGNGLTDFDCQRFMQKLVIDDYLSLRLFNTKHGTVIGYVNLANKGSNLLNKYKQQENVPPNERIYLHVSDSKEKRRSSKGHTTDLDNDESSISINKRKRLSQVTMSPFVNLC